MNETHITRNKQYRLSVYQLFNSLPSRFSSRSGQVNCLAYDVGAFPQSAGWAVIISIIFFLMNIRGEGVVSMTNLYGGPKPLVLSTQFNLP